jgi:hypothetical protein
MMESFWGTIQLRSSGGHAHFPALEVLQVRLRTDFRRALAAGLLAVVALAAGSNLGGLHAPELHVRLIALGLAAAFAVLGVIATRSAAHGVARAASHTSPGAGSAARLLCALIGYLVVLGATLGMLTLPWRHLLVGGFLRRCAPTTSTSAAHRRCRSSSVGGCVPHHRVVTAPGRYATVTRSPSMPTSSTPGSRWRVASAPALRFGDPRVMALAGALCALVHTITGFTNRSLRAQVSTLLGEPYSMSQMSYDLRRLRLKGLITRLPRSNTYVLTDEGQRVAIFYTKLHNRLLRPLLAAHDPPAPLPPRQALRVIDHHVEDYIRQARMTA